MAINTPTKSGVQSDVTKSDTRFEAVKTALM
jgi:hypothetical protein